MPSSDINVKHMHSRINRLSNDAIKAAHPEMYQVLYEGWLADVRDDTDYTARKRPSDRARSRAFVDLKDMYYDEYAAMRQEITDKVKAEVGYVDGRGAANHARRKSDNHVGEAQAKRRKRIERGNLDEEGIWQQLAVAAREFGMVYGEVVANGIPRADNYQMTAAAHQLRNAMLNTYGDLHFVRGRLHG